MLLDDSNMMPIWIWGPTSDFDESSTTIDDDAESDATAYPDGTVDPQEISSEPDRSHIM